MNLVLFIFSGSWFMQLKRAMDIILKEKSWIRYFLIIIHVIMRRGYSFVVHARQIKYFGGLIVCTFKNER
jgi:hypothetical protein